VQAGFSHCLLFVAAAGDGSNILIPLDSLAQRDLATLIQSSSDAYRKMSEDRFNLQHLLDHGLSSEDNEEVIVILQSAFRSLSKSTADAQAQEVASQIQGLISSEKPAAQFGSIWEVMLSTARNIPHQDADGQDFIINVIRILVATSPWSDLPGLAQVMRTNWSGSLPIVPTTPP
jgi:hypothetical protein